MKKYLTLILALLAFNVSAYADQYIQNLHSQAISHYESLSYKFTNIGDGWHTIKPMETICGEVIKPNNADPIFINESIKGTFRQEYGVSIRNSINYSKSDYWANGGQWLKRYPYITINNLNLNKTDTEGKGCFQNLSRTATIYVNFQIMPSK